MSEKVVQLLHCDRQAVSTTIDGVAGGTARTREITSISFESIFQKGLVFTTRALISKVVIKGALPAMSDNSLAEFDNLELADPEYSKGGKIDIIIGAAGLKRLMIPQVFVGSLLAQKTHLGWLLSGAYPEFEAEREDFCLNTAVTFGTSSARCAQLAADQEQRCPVPCKILATGAYVDDILDGAQSIEEAKDGLEDLSSLLGSASIEARKFVSNYPSIIGYLPKDHLDANQPHKIVGLVWDNVEDVL